MWKNNVSCVSYQNINLTQDSRSISFWFAYHFYYLRQLQPQPNRQSLCVVGNRPYQSVVIRQQVVVQSLGIGIRFENFVPCLEEGRIILSTRRFVYTSLILTTTERAYRKRCRGNGAKLRAVTPSFSTLICKRNRTHRRTLLDRKFSLFREKKIKQSESAFLTLFDTFLSHILANSLRDCKT